MAIAKKGERVIAVRDSDDDKVYIYGYGTYEGDFEAPIGPMGISWKACDEMGKRICGDKYHRPLNPRIKLDNGEVVWGMQCWWGLESGAKNFIGEKKVVEVPVEAIVSEDDEEE